MIARNLTGHGLHVVRVIDDGAVLPEEAIERRDRHQVDVVGQPFARRLEELLETMRRGDHGGAGVEREPLVLVDVGAPARLVALLEDRGGNAGGLQADGQRQPAEPAADDGRAW